MLWDPNKDKPIEPILDEVGQLMWKAADYLKTHKWGQGSLLAKDGKSVCMLGSLYKIETGFADCADCKTSPLTQIARNRLLKFLGRSPAAWNDEPNRKKSEVIAVLREAAKFKINEKIHLRVF